ncbi:alpha/beta hydrolase family protein [Chryseobacterium antibioticum]|uniref:alpha/beta hydrolase family protein n=1 Tax=Chryseobacterium antibioticum TaxID=2728847 RepID=UPI001E40E2EC|nr:dienelactone hydrolase family protein [Chryseobacterium antibioticum]
MRSKNKCLFLQSDKFNLKSLASELPLGQSASYWKYLLDYKPLDEVKNIKSPMLFAQGGRDYQVTEKDFALWKNQLKTNKTAIFKWYPSLNHLFIKGSGIPSPKDYEIKGNVDGEFLNDLIQFILK